MPTTKLQTETVNTHQLNIGDVVVCWGGLFKLTTRNVAQPSHFDHKYAESTRELMGDTLWFDTEFLMDVDGENPCMIPAAWLPWTVQGNGLARHARVICD